MTKPSQSAQRRDGSQYPQKPRIQDDFYPLQKAELFALRQAKLINNTAYVYLAIRWQNPYSDRPITINAKEFSLEWGIPESSVYEAIAALKRAKIIKIQTRELVIEWNRSQQEDDSRNPEFVLRSWNPFWNPVNDSEISENPVVEPSSSKGFSAQRSKTLKTLKTNSEKEREKQDEKSNDQTEGLEETSNTLAPLTHVEAEKRASHLEPIDTAWDKFSAPGADPDFFEFVVRRAAKFETPVPADVRCAAEAWIRKQGHILYQEYVTWQHKHREAARRQTQPEALAVLQLPVQAEMTEDERRANALARLKVKYQMPQFRKAAIAECQEWGFVIDRDGIHDHERQGG